MEKEVGGSCEAEEGASDRPEGAVVGGGRLSLREREEEPKEGDEGVVDHGTGSVARVVGRLWRPLRIGT